MQELKKKEDFQLIYQLFDKMLSISIKKSKYRYYENYWIFQIVPEKVIERWNSILRLLLQKPSKNRLYKFFMIKNANEADETTIDYIDKIYENMIEEYEIYRMKQMDRLYREFHEQYQDFYNDLMIFYLLPEGHETRLRTKKDRIEYMEFWINPKNQEKIRKNRRWMFEFSKFCFFKFDELYFSSSKNGLTIYSWSIDEYLGRCHVDWKDMEGTYDCILLSWSEFRQYLS